MAATFYQASHNCRRIKFFTTAPPRYSHEFRFLSSYYFFSRRKRFVKRFSFQNNEEDISRGEYQGEQYSTNSSQIVVEKDLSMIVRNAVETISESRDSDHPVLILDSRNSRWIKGNDFYAIQIHSISRKLFLDWLPITKLERL